MTKFINNVKLAWLKGVEVVGTSASNLASNAKFKVAEINLQTRRREVMAEFTQKAYDLWQQGAVLPEPLSGMLQEVSDLDERLNLLRAQRYATVDGEGEKQPVDSPEAHTVEAESEAAAQPQAVDTSLEGQPDATFSPEEEAHTSPAGEEPAPSDEAF